MKEKAENRLFSIIVPVYNVECYVGKCLASIFEQGLNPDLYEVIVVDDGTKGKQSKKGYCLKFLSSLPTKY